MKLASEMNGNGDSNVVGAKVGKLAAVPVNDPAVAPNQKLVDASVRVAKAVRKARAAAEAKRKAAGINSDSDSPNDSPPDIEAAEAALAHISRAQPMNWTSRLGPVGQAIEEWRNVMVEDLGGPENVTAMQLVVVDLAAKTLIMLDVIDQYILDPDEQKILDVKKGQVRFIVMQRKVLADSLEKYMRDLGFVRKRAAKTVNAIIEELSKASDLDKATMDAVREPSVEDEIRLQRRRAGLDVDVDGGVGVDVDNENLDEGAIEVESKHVDERAVDERTNERIDDERTDDEDEEDAEPD